MDWHRRLVHFDPAELGSVVEKAERDGYWVFVLNGEKITDGDDFFNAVRATFPLDPPLASNRVWDALSDSLWQALFNTPSDRIAIIWPRSDRMAKGDSDDYAIAIEILQDVVESFKNPAFTSDHPKQICLFLGQ